MLTKYTLSKFLLPLTLLLFFLFSLTMIHLYLHSDIINLTETGNNVVNASIPCDYTNGKWVHNAKISPLYNSTTCDTIKEGQKCINHGRQDKDYLYWRWKPKNCKLPRFDSLIFLQLFKNKQLAFVGDSIARNQVESLLCLLSSSSLPHQLLYSNGEDNKFRKFHFPSHNFSISIYWSPFLVKGIEKSSLISYNTLFLESVDEKWGDYISEYDAIVLSIGHWYLLPNVFYYQDSLLGCHYCPSFKNCSEIGFYDVFGMAFRTALNVIIERSRGVVVDVIVTTFSPAHFEGEWDKLGACSKTKPYKPNEKKLEGMDAEMRDYEMKEIKDARKRANKKNDDVRIHVVDVTKLSLLRPDGHPGPYMYPFPFRNGVSEHVQNDCVHWCLPGAIDTWNEILLDIFK